MKFIISFCFKLWSFSLVVVPFLVYVIDYLTWGELLKSLDLLGDFLVITVSCGIGGLILMPVFIFSLWIFKRLHYEGSQKIIFFILMTILVTTIASLSMSISLNQNWGEYLFGVNGIIIQSSYVITWAVFAFLSRKFFFGLPSRPVDLNVLDEIP